jgi:histidinol-phosphate aminotransferase
VVATREQLATQLRALDFEVLPSASNFLFVRHPRRPARELFASLRDRSIVVRYFDQPRIDDFLRITVGSDRDCAVLLDALQDLL